MNFKQRTEHLDKKFDELEDCLLAHGLTEEQVCDEIRPMIKDAVAKAMDWFLAGFLDYIRDEMKESNNELYSEIYQTD